MRIFPIICSLCILVTAAGCAQITETAKTIWGSSTRALENARSDAISKTYRCSFNDCYEAVLNLARREQEGLLLNTGEDEDDEETPEIKTVYTGEFDVFINNRKERHLVVMGVKGAVNTTEVGIFFDQPTLTTVKVDISSLSSSAKRTVAETVFEELDLRFSEVQ